MSDALLAFLITVAILVFLFVWVPILHLCNSACQRFFPRQPSAAAPDLREPRRISSMGRREPRSAYDK